MGGSLGQASPPSRLLKNRPWRNLAFFLFLLPEAEVHFAERPT